ncbi:hypothetical protein AB0L85_29765 [Streptomyces sp. NPDC052051]|uniref:hypothetical protein n=1 Tax=Streptomyces sp. NPDC052051 TaxID=3154649 RepID=UPI0034238183
MGTPPAAARADNGCAGLDVCFCKTADDWAQGRPTGSYQCLAPHEQRVLQPDVASTVYIDGKAGC